MCAAAGFIRIWAEQRQMSAESTEHKSHWLQPKIHFQTPAPPLPEKRRETKFGGGETAWNSNLLHHDLNMFWHLPRLPRDVAKHLETTTLIISCNHVTLLNIEISCNIKAARREDKHRVCQPPANPFARLLSCGLPWLPLREISGPSPGSRSMRLQ